MAKFEEVFEDVQALFDAEITASGLEQVINVKILSNDKLKQIGKVIKANDLLKHMTNEDIVILVNEKVFENLTDEQKKIIVSELVAEIYYDSEKDKVVIVKPDVHTFSLILTKYGADNYLALNTLIKQIFEQENDKASEEA